MHMLMFLVQIQLSKNLSSSFKNVIVVYFWKLCCKQCHENEYMMLSPPTTTWKEARRYLWVCTGEDTCRLPGINSTFWDSAHKELKLLQVFYLKVLLCTLLPHLTQNNVSFLKHSILAHITYHLTLTNSCLYLIDVTAQLFFAVHDTGAISCKEEERMCISKRRDKDVLNNSHHT